MAVLNKTFLLNRKFEGAMRRGMNKVSLKKSGMLILSNNLTILLNLH